MTAALDHSSSARDVLRAERTPRPSEDAVAPIFPLTAAIVSTLPELDLLAADWEALEARSAAPCLFQRHAWIRTVAASIEKEPAHDMPWRVIALRRGGHLVAVLPVSIPRNGFPRIATNLAEPISPYADILMPDPDPAVLPAIRTALLGLGVDILVMRRVRSDAMLRSIAHGEATIASQHSPFADLSRVSDLDAFAKATFRDAGADRRRNRKRLMRVGAMQVRFVQDATEAAELGGLAFGWKREWLKKKGFRTAAFDDPALARAQEALFGTPGLGVFGTLLQIDGEPIGLEIGYRLRDRHYCVFGSFRPGFDRYSPGTVQMEDTIAACIADGVPIYDLLPIDDPYKAAWSTGRTQIDDLVIPVSPTGRLWTDVIELRLKPWLRERMPVLLESLRTAGQRRTTSTEQSA